MECKGVLFKKFADIDVFDIEVDAKDIETFCKVVKALEPTFGGMNLEDVKSPECFIIERRLRSEMQVPVFHDDQHGTAIITGAALINALELAGKRAADVKVVFVGAGAAAVGCAEQVPRILPEEAQSVRADISMATGRSDYHNQVNNVLGFPGIFRGALDVRAKAINDEMKLAASRALAELARQDVPESVSAAYGGQVFTFGREYIIPKPFDPRVLTAVAPAVAEAAIESGVARVRVDRATYAETLRRRQGRTYEVMSVVVSRARRRMTRIAFPEGNHPRILRAAQELLEERICTPVLLGNCDHIREQAREAHLAALDDVEIIDPLHSDRLEVYARAFYE